jgi:hypothetical protein
MPKWKDLYLKVPKHPSQVDLVPQEKPSKSMNKKLVKSKEVVYYLPTMFRAYEYCVYKKEGDDPVGGGVFRFVVV